MWSHWRGRINSFDLLAMLFLRPLPQMAYCWLTFNFLSARTSGPFLQTCFQSVLSLPWLLSPGAELGTSLCWTWESYWPISPASWGPSEWQHNYLAFLNPFFTQAFVGHLMLVHFLSMFAFSQELFLLPPLHHFPFFWMDCWRGWSLKIGQLLDFSSGLCLMEFFQAGPWTGQRLISLQSDPKYKVVILLSALLPSVSMLNFSISWPLQPRLSPSLISLISSSMFANMRCRRASPVLGFLTTG